MFKSVVQTGFAVAAVAVSMTVAGLGHAAAAPTITTHPDGTVQFSPTADEWWTCVAGSLAAPYFSLQASQPGPASRFARFTPGIDVGVVCAGTRGEFTFAKIVRPGKPVSARTE